MKKILTAILLMIIQSFPVYSQQNIIKGTHNNMPLMENRISHLGLPKVLNDVNGEALEKIHVKFNHSKSGDYESDDIIFHEYQVQESSSIFSFEKIPVQFQLYAREENDTAQVVYSGSTTTQNIDSVFLKTFKNGVLIEEQSQMLNYSGNKGTFNFSQGIHAELSKYSFQLYYKKQGEMFSDNEVTDVVCGDVLIIQGQSNAEATRSWAGNIDITNDYIRSLGQMNSGNSSTWAIAHAKSKGIGGIGAWGMVLCDSLVKKYQIPQAVFNGAKG
ncbi:MAG: hypothetical protein KAS04_06520, partial [Candidatus Aenigmarchaeota archaeon]|nr:hypothetical protein [Candidatus Aenigmarchaeota archaeon]